MPRRSRIIEAGSDLFSLRGFSAVSTEDIAKLSNVNESTIFRLFGNKLSLARAVIESHFSRLSTECALNPDDLAASTRLYAAWAVHVMTRRFVRVYMAFSIEAPGVLQQRVMPMTMRMIEVIEAAQKRGDVIDGDPKEIVRSLLDAIVGHAVLSSIEHPIAFGPDPSFETGLRTASIWLKGIQRNARDDSQKWKSSLLHNDDSNVNLTLEQSD